MNAGASQWLNASILELVVVFAFLPVSSRLKRRVCCAENHPGLHQRTASRVVHGTIV